MADLFQVVHTKFMTGMPFVLSLSGYTLCRCHSPTDTRLLHKGNVIALLLCETVRFCFASSSLLFPCFNVLIVQFVFDLCESIQNE